MHNSRNCHLFINFGFEPYFLRKFWKASSLENDLFIVNSIVVKFKFKKRGIFMIILQKFFLTSRIDERSPSGIR
jgi:hypothetical protein